MSKSPRAISGCAWRERLVFYANIDFDVMSAKEILLELAEKLPPDATLSDAIYELEFRQAVEQGLEELDRGESMPIEEVRSKIAEWAGRS
jgi:predicted transcriptional regulator